MELASPDAARQLAHFGTAEDLAMEPETAGHRRRRSSLINPLQPPATETESSRPGARAPQHGRRPVRSPRKSSRTRATEGSKADHPGSDDESSADVELASLSEEDEGLQDDEETGLTAGERKKRTRRKRRNTLMDQRVVPTGDVNITAAERKEADQSVIKRSLINGGLILLWYIFSLSISLVSS